MRVSKQWCAFSKCWLNLGHLVEEVNEEQAEQGNQEARFFWVRRSAGLLRSPSSFKPLGPDSLTVPQTGVPLKPLLEGRAPFPVRGALASPWRNAFASYSRDKWPAV